jgi:hypothetical protein
LNVFWLSEEREGVKSPYSPAGSVLDPIQVALQ